MQTQSSAPLPLTPGLCAGAMHEGMQNGKGVHSRGAHARTGSGVGTPLCAHLAWNRGPGRCTNQAGGAPPLLCNCFYANGCTQRVRQGVGEVRVHMRAGGGAHPPFLCPQLHTNCGGTRLGGGCKKGRRGHIQKGKGCTAPRPFIHVLLTQTTDSV